MAVQPLGARVALLGAGVALLGARVALLGARIALLGWLCTYVVALFPGCKGGRENTFLLLGGLGTRINNPVMVGMS